MNTRQILTFSWYVFVREVTMVVIILLIPIVFITIGFKLEKFKEIPTILRNTRAKFNESVSKKLNSCKRGLP